MKKIFISALSLTFTAVFSQVGIDTTAPKATLDVVGKPTDLLKVDGIIAPRLTGNQLKTKDALYGTDQNATFVYATAAASPTTAKTIEVTKAGYYYYDAVLGKWVAFQSSTGTSTTTNVISNPINTITSTVNGISSSTNAVNTVSNTSAANSNTLSTTVNGVVGTDVTLVKSVSNTSAANSNTLSTTVNGVVGTDVTLVKSVSNTSAANSNTLSTTVNGVVGTDVTLVKSVGNTSAANSNTLSTTVNGVSGTTVDLVKSVSNSLSASNQLTTEVNGVSSDPISLNIANIYTSNGTLASNRTVAMTDKTLNFSGTGHFGIGGVDAIAKLNVNGSIQFDGDSHYGVGKVYDDSRGEKYGLTQSVYFPASGAGTSPGTRIYTSGKSSVLGHISFGKYTSPTSYTEWARFSHDVGFLGLGTNNPTQRLHVIGNILASGTITPDYVFQKYFDGYSTLKPDYQMMSLSDVKDFIRINKHLPGVPSAADVEKQGGILINRSVEINLEKIEELYLHVFEQSELIKKQQQDINALNIKLDKIQEKITF